MAPSIETVKCFIFLGGTTGSSLKARELPLWQTMEKDDILPMASMEADQKGQSLFVTLKYKMICNNLLIFQGLRLVI